MSKLEIKIIDDEMNVTNHIEVKSEDAKCLTNVFNRAIFDIANSVPDSGFKAWQRDDRVYVGTDSFHFSFPVSVFDR